MNKKPMGDQASVISPTGDEGAESVSDASVSRTPTAIIRAERLRRVGILGTEYGTIIAFIAILIAFSILRPNVFPTTTNFSNVLSQSAPLVVMCVGITFVAIGNELDLSVGYTASYASLLSTGLMSQSRLPVLIAIAITLAVGCLIGFVNGILVSKVGINAVIATLAVGNVVLGFNYWYSNGTPVTRGIPESFLDLSTDKIGPIPAYIVIAAVVSVVAIMILRYTRLGQEVQAVGGNREAARLAGVRVDRARTLPFVFCGFTAALSGIMIASLIGSGTSNSGDAYLLSAYAAAFLGSATFHAGQFNVIGTLIGVLILQFVFNGLAIFGMPVFVQSLVTGAILIVAVSMSSVGRRLLSR